MYRPFYNKKPSVVNLPYSNCETVEENFAVNKIKKLISMPRAVLFFTLMETETEFHRKIDFKLSEKHLNTAHVFLEP